MGFLATPPQKITSPSIKSTYYTADQQHLIRKIFEGMTNPAWQVLFGKIGGLVTDAGGFAAHPAVLAREYEIPAVVGTSVATQRINTGDRIRVDGSAGVVTVLEAATASVARLD